MRQVLLNNSGALLARMPRPVIDSGTVLVKVSYSMISIGTELAGLRKTKLEAQKNVPLAASSTNPSATPVARTSQVKDVARTAMIYLGKAIRDPKKALLRVQQLARRQVVQSVETLQNHLPGIIPETMVTTLLDTEQDEMGWNVGYSAVGEVIAVGPDVSDIAPGDYVACAGAGKANHADYINVPRNLVCRIPKNCDLKEASSATIGTIAMQGIRRADPQLGETIGVIGLGLIGQITVQLLKASGCKVIGFDLSAERVTKAHDLGMDEGSSDPGNFQRQVRNATQSYGFDKTIITAATSSDVVINMAMEVTRRKGRVIIVGDVGLNVKRQDFYRKEIDLLMSSSYGPGRYDADYEEHGHDYPYAYVRWTSNRNMAAYLSLLAEKKLTILPLIDRVVPVSDVKKVYDELADVDNAQPLAVVLEYPDDTRIFTEKSDATLIKPKGHRKARSDACQYVLVGAGAFGTSMLVPQMEKLNEYFFLKGIVSRDAVRGGNYAKSQGLELFASDLGEILNQPEIDLCVIATRHHLHAEQVIAALNAGKNIFIEKPLATTWAHLDDIEKTYRELSNPPMIMVGFNRRFSPAIQALKPLVAQRKTPLLIQYRLNGGYIPSEHWIQTKEGAGRNIGEACHMYDVFRYLVDAPILSIQASSINPGNLPYFHNDNFVATCTYEDGSLCTLTYTALGPSQGLGKERVEVFCDGEAYLIDDYRSLVKTSDKTVLWTGEMDKGHFKELELLGIALKNGTQAPISFDELVETTAVSLRVEDLIYGRM